MSNWKTNLPRFVAGGFALFVVAANVNPDATPSLPLVSDVTPVRATVSYFGRSESKFMSHQEYKTMQQRSSSSLLGGLTQELENAVDGVSRELNRESESLFGGKDGRSPLKLDGTCKTRENNVKRHESCYSLQRAGGYDIVARSGLLGVNRWSVYPTTNEAYRNGKACKGDLTIKKNNFLGRTITASCSHRSGNWSINFPVN